MEKEFVQQGKVDTSYFGIESDPAGKDQHSLGAKLDAGKPRPGLVLGSFARALMEVTKVGTFGAAKYTDDGWLYVPEAAKRYTEAGMRHWLKAEMGEVIDPDSGLKHLAHEAWNALARLELAIRREERTELNAKKEAELDKEREKRAAERQEKEKKWAKRDKIAKFIIAVIVLSLMVLLSMMWGKAHAARLNHEDWYVQKLCQGTIEYVLPDKTRVDCLTEDNAFEYDFADKWYEGMGQSLWYAAYTARRAGVVLIVEDAKHLKYVDRSWRLIRHYNLPIDLQWFDAREEK